MSKRLDYSGPGAGTAFGLERLLDVSFSDIDQMCEAVKTWDLEFRPLRLPPVGESVGRISQSRCGPLEIGYARILTGIDQVGAPPAGLLTFVILEKRLRKLWWRGHDVGNEQVLVFPVGSELRSLSGSDFEIHTISVAEKVVAELCDELEVRWPGCRGRPEVFQVPPYVLGFIRRKLRRFRDGSMEEPWAEGRQILLDLISFWLFATNRPIKGRPCPRARDMAVRKAIELMEQADWSEFSMATLQRSIGVGERTLQYAFRERFGMTPAAFVKARRLTLARSELARAANGETTVGAVMAKAGFTHAGQFACDYRRSFHELPSETLERIRPAGGGNCYRAPFE
jgi:AraC family transcriptional regulator, ethanolamine operon transcriptional activator